MGVIKRIVSNYLRRPNFKNYWLSLKNKDQLPSDLVFAVDFFIKTTSYNLTSKYWEYLNIKHTNHIFRKQGKRLWNKYSKALLYFYFL